MCLSQLGGYMGERIKHIIALGTYIVVEEVGKIVAWVYAQAVMMWISGHSVSRTLARGRGSLLTTYKQG
jgi:hypothetical protein